MFGKAFLAALFLFASQPAALADGDPVVGKKVFARCSACHVADKPTNRVGPTLLGVVGRQAGTVEGYKYSGPMMAKSAEGLVWDEASLTNYLTSPKAFLPGGTMAFAGLKKPQEVADVIAYLASFPQP